MVRRLKRSIGDPRDGRIEHPSSKVVRRSRHLGTRFHDGLDDFNNPFGNLPALDTGLRFFRMDSHAPIRQPLDYPQRYAPTSITASRTAGIHAVSFQSL